MENKSNLLSFHEQGYSCSQSVLAVYAEKSGIATELALKLATPFSGGVSRMGQMCGALSGAIMVIGLAYGNATPEDKEAKEKTIQLTREFVNRFQERNGDFRCPALLGYDLSKPEERQIVKEQNLTQTRCRKFVSDAIELLNELREQNP